VGALGLVWQRGERSFAAVWTSDRYDEKAKTVTGAKLRATWPAMRLWRCVYCLLKLGSVGGRFGQGVVRAGLR